MPSEEVKRLRFQLAQEREISRTLAEQLGLYRDLFSRIRNLAAAGEGAETVLSLPEPPPETSSRSLSASGHPTPKRPATRKPHGH